MDYEITPQRQQYLDARGYIILTACPGSGKTTSIVKKLHTVSQFCSKKYGSHTGFACLSFTNKACDELKDKYSDMHKENLLPPNIVSTIDSFVMQYVVLPFWYLCKECGARPVIINEKDALSDIYYITINRDGALKKTLVFKDYYKYVNSKDKNPSKIERRKNGYTLNNRSLKNEEEKLYCEKFFLYRLNKGFITSNDAIWIACEILRQNKDIAQALVNSFPYMIIDEAQDCSEMQFYFFSMLTEAGLANIEYVGDICQAIYSYRNAQPKYLQDLTTNNMWKHISFTECRRSNQRIINLYSILKPNCIPPITAHNVADKGIPIIVYLYDESNIKSIMRHFHNQCNEHNLGTRMVLARGRALCKKLSGITDTDFKFWTKSFPNLLIDAKFDFEDNDIKNAFRKTRIALAELKYPADISQRKLFLQSIEHDVDYNCRIFSILQNMPSFSLAFREWTSQMGMILKDFCKLPETPDFGSRKKSCIEGLTINDLKELSVEQFYQSNDENSEYCKVINTIHSVKGATLDGVLLFLTEDINTQTISLNDFIKRNPHGSMTEKQCMIYVACSRASQFLALAVPSAVREEKISEALNGMAFELKKINLQTELDFNEKV